MESVFSKAWVIWPTPWCVRPSSRPWPVLFPWTHWDQCCSGCVRDFGFFSSGYHFSINWAGLMMICSHQAKIMQALFIIGQEDHWCPDFEISDFFIFYCDTWFLEITLFLRGFLWGIWRQAQRAQLDLCRTSHSCSATWTPRYPACSPARKGWFRRHRTRRQSSERGDFWWWDMGHGPIWHNSF